MAFIAFLGLVFTMAEVLIVHLGGVAGRIELSLEIRRIQQVTVCWFLAAIPLFLDAAGGKSRLSHRITSGFLYTGAGVALALSILAFVQPDWFSSVTEQNQAAETYRSSLGRGRSGWAMSARDVLLGIYALYALVVISTRVFRKDRKTYLGPALLGLGVALLFGVDDLVHRFAGVHVGPFADVRYPRTVVGVTLFVFGAMLSTTTKFIESNREVYRAHSRLRDQKRELAYLAFFDQLTLVRNRKAFYRRLESAIGGGERRSDSSSLALLYVDLDGFKQVNDGYGHSTGDTVLKEAAGRFSDVIRRSDELFRLGGDEFVVVLSDLAHPEDAGLVARKLIGALDDPLYANGRPFYLGASVGISIAPEDGQSPQELVQAADRALYTAKRHGNTYAYHDPAIQNTSIRNLRIVSGLHDAIRADQFYLQYQPILEVQGELVGAEALLRWTHPSWGEIPTATFIRVAEQSRLIVQVGKWVIEHACEEVARMRSHGLRAPVSINLSTKQLRRHGFLDDLEQAMHHAGLQPADLLFEITEGSLVEDMDAVADTLGAATKRGLRFEVDDFGKGYSTLAYLKNLPLHAIKVDRSFVRELPDSEEDVAILKGVQEIARGLGVIMVAEGIETEAQYAFLSSLGLDYYQGYLFGRPMSSQDLIEGYVRSSSGRRRQGAT